MRTEQWTKDIEGMTSAVDVVVNEEGIVKVDPGVLEEFGLDAVYSPLVADAARERFVLHIPYERVAEALTSKGWERAGAQAEEVS